MANKAFILSPRVSDRARLTASEAVGGMSVGNVQIARPKRKWRSTSSTPYIVGYFHPDDFPTIPTVDTMVLGFANWGPTDTGTFRMATSEANLVASPGFTYDIDASLADIDGFYRLSHRPFVFTAQSTYRWFRLDFSFAATYVQMGRFMLGERVEPACDVKSGWTTSFEEEVAQTVDLGGEESPRHMGVRRSMEVQWQFLTEAEMNNTSGDPCLYTTLLERGSSRDVALVVGATDTPNIMPRMVVGRVKRQFSFPHTFEVGGPVTTPLFGLSVTVAEMAPTEMT